MESLAYLIDTCSEDELLDRDMAFDNWHADGQYRDELLERALERAEAKAHAQEQAAARDDAHAAAAATGAAYESSAAGAAASGASADDHATALRLYGKSPKRNLSIYFDGSIGLVSFGALI